MSKKRNFKCINALLALLLIGMMAGAASASPQLVLTLTPGSKAANFTSAVLLDKTGATVESASSISSDGLTAFFDLTSITPDFYFIEVNGLKGDHVPTYIDNNAITQNQSVTGSLTSSVIGDATNPTKYRIKARSGGRHPVVNYYTGQNESKMPFVIVYNTSVQKIEIRVVNTSELLTSFTPSLATHPAYGESFQAWQLAVGSSLPNHGQYYNNTDSLCNFCHLNMNTKPANYTDVATSNGWCYRCHYGGTNGGDSNGFVDPTIISATPTPTPTPTPTAAPLLVSSITPTSRNAVVGTPVTIFMSVINGGGATAAGVSITQASSLPVTISYMPWNGTAFTGPANTPVNIAAGGTANFVLTITATSAFTTSSLTFNVSGTNAAAAPISGVNTLTMAATTPAAALADVIMISTSLNVNTPVNTPTSFAVAASNVGATATGVNFVVSVPPSITGLAVQVNQTNPATGAIIGPATGLTINAGAQPTFAVFLTPTQPIAFDPTNNRITLKLVDGSGNVIGAQSVAISTT